MDEVFLIGMLMERAVRDLCIIGGVGSLLLLKYMLIVQGIVLKGAACAWFLFAPLMLIRPPNRLAD